MDNLSSHKARAAREMIETADASLLYLPSHSSDPNSVEQAFSKLRVAVAMNTHDDFALLSRVQVSSTVPVRA